MCDSDCSSRLAWAPDLFHARQALFSLPSSPRQGVTSLASPVVAVHTLPAQRQRHSTAFFPAKSSVHPRTPVSASKGSDHQAKAHAVAVPTVSPNRDGFQFLPPLPLGSVEQTDLILHQCCPMTLIWHYIIIIIIIIMITIHCHWMTWKFMHESSQLSLNYKKGKYLPLPQTSNSYSWMSKKQTNKQTTTTHLLD